MESGASTGETAAAGPREHGGRLAAACARFPRAPRPFLDLSTGINPRPYPLAPLAPQALRRLPEPEEEAALRAAAATAYGVADPACVAAAPGTQLLINLLPLLRPAGSVAVLGPTYAEHAAAWRGAGHEVTETDDLADLPAADTAVVVNPNNPDGRLLPPGHLLALAETLAEQDGLLVVDEAFADLVPAAAGLAAALPRPGLVLLRSFGKTYGLAGLRLGFALAAPEIAAEIRDALGPWAVSGPALAAGLQALPDRAWLAATAERLAGEAARLDALIAAGGLEPLGGTPLFRLAAHPRAAALWEGLGEAGILVRRFPERPALLRFGLPADEPGWERLAAALRTGNQR